MQTQTRNKTAVPQPYHIKPDGGLSLDFHRGQWRAWDSTARFVVVLAGTQGGKTSFGPHWLYREIKMRGPGDYLVVTPTYPLLNLKALPELLRIFQGIMRLGDYKKADRVFQFDALGEIRTWGSEQETETRVLFGHAQDPESLESATAKGGWLDEAGQKKFRLGSFEAIVRRLSLAQGRLLLTTTPYDLGWIKQSFWDRRGERDDAEVIRFDSTENPAFPQEEMDRARRTLPRWKFDMFYRAIFTRPAGMIYDCFDEANKVKRFPIPAGWRRYAGVDFGGVNMAAVKIAEDPTTNNLYAFATYHAGGKTAEGHARAIQASEPVAVAYGGAGSEDQWRLEFGRGGLPIHQPPVKDVEVGIDRVFGLFQTKRLYIFDDLEDLLDEVGSYSRELDEMGNPTEAIADKSSYHLLDALRYICSYLNMSPSHMPKTQPLEDNKWAKAGMKTTAKGGKWRL